MPVQVQDQDQAYKTKVEYGVAIVVILIGLFFVYQASGITTSKEAIGPRTMPMFLAVSLVAGGVLIGLRSYLGKAGQIADGYGFRESNLVRISQVICCGVLFLILFWGFGYFTALAVTFIAMMYAFGVRAWAGMIAGALILAVLFQMLFMGVMLLNDPRGHIVDMRPYTNWITGAK